MKKYDQIMAPVQDLQNGANIWPEIIFVVILSFFFW